MIEVAHAIRHGDVRGAEGLCTTGGVANVATDCLKRQPRLRSHWRRRL
jgi:hypothetical protein